MRATTPRIVWTQFSPVSKYQDGPKILTSGVGPITLTDPAIPTTMSTIPPIIKIFLGLIILKD